MKNLLFAILSIITFSGYTQTDAIRKKNFNIDNGIAAEGYDVVSYFDGNPVAGKPSIKANYKGTNYLFVSQPNLTRFKSNPEKYVPQYGGWCAYAMGASGEKVKIDPETYKITDGKLYLFYNFWGNNTLTDWNKNEQNLMNNANRNWNKIIE
jgi:YHS domain-containing protein